MGDLEGRGQVRGGGDPICGGEGGSPICVSPWQEEDPISLDTFFQQLMARGNSVKVNVCDYNERF